MILSLQIAHSRPSRSREYTAFENLSGHLATENVSIRVARSITMSALCRMHSFRNAKVTDMLVRDIDEYLADVTYDNFASIYNCVKVGWIN